MDTSETWIKMRLAAIPDLGMGEPPEFIGLTECTWLNPTIYIDHKGDWYYSDETKACQLERQDQLQAMSGLHWVEYDALCLQFIKDYTMSKEIVGIQAVMKEKYNKVWNGQEWIQS